MLLDLREIIEIPGKSVPFECSLNTENLDFESVREYKSAPVAKGKVVNEAGILRLEGELRADMVCVCDRCGKEFESTKVMELSALITDGESDNPEAFELEGDKLDLEDALETLLILDMETKFLCDTECKGLCSKCGANLNLGSCKCGREIDPRLAVLEQLLDK